MIRQAAGSPFCDGRVTLFADPTFLHLNTLARPATVGKLGPGDTIWATVGSGKGVNYFFRWLSWRVTLFFGTTFLHMNGS